MLKPLQYGPKRNVPARQETVNLKELSARINTRMAKRYEAERAARFAVPQNFTPDPNLTPEGIVQRGRQIQEEILGQSQADTFKRTGAIAEEMATPAKETAKKAAKTAKEAEPATKETAKNLKGTFENILTTIKKHKIASAIIAAVLVAGGILGIKEAAENKNEEV